MYWKGRRQEKEAYSDCLSTPQPFSQLAVHHQPITLLPMLNYAFHSIWPRASEPECIFSTSGLSGNWAPHLRRISATINLSTTLFLSQEDRKCLLCIVQFAVSQQKRLTSLHQACREQSQPASTSDSWEAIRIIFSLMHTLYKRG